MIVVAYLLSFLCLILNGALFVRLKPPYQFMILWLPQLVQHALSPFLVLMGGLGALLAWLYQAPVTMVAGALGAGLSAVYIWRVVGSRADFASAFGADWQDKILAPQRSRLLQRRWTLVLPRTGVPHGERNIPFWTIPNTDRILLCDVWQPPDNVDRSGLAFIYFHGGTWFLGDKDFFTRQFFRQLVAQGHVVMDVAYRLCPEVGISGMVGDVKRAVAWMKANAARYHVNPERIVLGGGSAGAHLALLAAYAPDHPQLTPPDVQGGDRSVRAVVSYYGPTDLRAAYHHMRHERGIGRPRPEVGQPGADKAVSFRDSGRLDILLGGHPHEVPAMYELASPVAHVHSDCPPTLLIEGDLDCITPIAAFHELYRRLVDCGVPAIHVVYPRTQHAFDLLLPQVSPPAQAALYEVERFLALMV